ncbi:RasGEF domain-containing protein [Colletotrichum nymphaeae SA-01]|uniref:RasGEF domain-containing protein n=1 Tax=Colletotrichum nymphaeae SA-01 TaxID=1460502 RepID=A0A135SD11_9PEZI|nr:RasGEF domain-containing protein [Colletotrichum nymphaeae SA-01]
MASDPIGARKAHRSSEGSRIPSKYYHADHSTAAAAVSSFSSSSRRTDRDAAHRSAPAAPKRHTPHYAVHRESSIEPIRPSATGSEQTANYRDSFISIVDDPFFLRFDDNNIEGALALDPRWTATSFDDADAEDEGEENENEKENADDSQDDEDEEEEEFDFDAFEFRDDDTPNERWPPPRRESLIIGHSLYWVIMPH